jgi:protein-tyrosine phosphatase
MIDARPTTRGLLAWWRGRTTLDRIGPGLWMGGFPRPGGLVLRTIEDVGMQHVVTTTFERPHLPPGVSSRYVPFLDLDLPYMEPLVRAARDIAERIRGGQQVYVHCGHGYDRSGLVVALALRELHPSLTGAEILDLIRTARGSEALHNRRFARYVRTLPPLEQEQDVRSVQPLGFLGHTSALEPVRPL